MSLQEIEVLDDLVVALKLVPDRDGGGANAEENDDANANDNSIADTDENKENINNSAATDLSGSQNPVRVKADRPKIIDY